MKTDKSSLRRYAIMAGAGIVFAASLVGLLKVCSSPHPFADTGYRHSEGDTLDVAIQYSPMMLYSYDDTLGGFSYDFLRQMADAEGMELKFHPVVSLDQALYRLKHGGYDIVVADLPMTGNYMDSLAFTTPLYLDRMVLVQPAGDSLSVTSQLDLAGKDVWVPSNSPAMARLRNLSDEIGETIYVHSDPHYGPEQLVILVGTGELPLVVVNRQTAESLASDYPDVDVSTAVSFTQFQSWLVSGSDSAFVDTIDSRIRRFQSTASYRRLLDRYGLSGVQ